MIEMTFAKIQNEKGKQMATFKCKMCGGDLEISQDKKMCTCEYCGTQQTLPNLNSDKKMNLYARANHLRRNNEFDKAMLIYESILEEDSEDSEVYWSLVLCKYGIDYVEENGTHKRIPTCHRTQFASIKSDADYKKALEYADAEQKTIYVKEAEEIDGIQKEILSISSKEDPFDIFICYKESDNSGNRTVDSVLAQDIYYQLVNEGYKVFFSRITLESKLGQAYEPYIFSALNTSRIMLVVGTEQEYFEAVWVKNEWSRYLGMIQKGDDKIIIPVYRDMDPYSLPSEFSHLQAQDMSKLGFVQDLIRGINKILKKDKGNNDTKENSNGPEVPLIKRAFLLIEDGDIHKSKEILENALNINPENGEIYVAQLLISLGLRTRSELQKEINRFIDNPYCIKAMRFASPKLKAELEEADKTIINRIQEEQEQEKKLKYEQEKAQKWNFYTSLCERMNNEAKLTERDFMEILRGFISLEGFEDSEERAFQIKAVIYQNASNKINNLLKSREIEDVIALFDNLGDYKDSIDKKKWLIEKSKIIKKRERRKKATIGGGVLTAIFFCFLMFSVIRNSKYNSMIEYEEEGYIGEAYALGKSLGTYKDSETITSDLLSRLDELYTEVLEVKETDKVQASTLLEKIIPYNDSKELKSEIDNSLEEEYKNAVSLYNAESYQGAKALFTEIVTYKDSQNYLDNCGNCEITGHFFEKTYCDENSVCSVCGAEKEDAVQCIPGVEATCTEPQTCTVCGKVLEEALGHQFTEATCTEPAVCMRCGEVSDAVIGHQYSEATCTEAAKCIICGEVDSQSSALGHDYNRYGICSRCGDEYSCEYLIDTGSQEYLAFYDDYYPGDNVFDGTWTLTTKVDFVGRIWYKLYTSNSDTPEIHYYGEKFHYSKEGNYSGEWYEEGKYIYKKVIFGVDID